MTGRPPAAIRGTRAEAHFISSTPSGRIRLTGNYGPNSLGHVALIKLDYGSARRPGVYELKLHFGNDGGKEPASLSPPLTWLLR